MARLICLGSSPFSCPAGERWGVRASWVLRALSVPCPPFLSVQEEAGEVLSRELGLPTCRSSGPHGRGRSSPAARKGSAAASEVPDWKPESMGRKVCDRLRANCVSSVVVASFS